MPKKTPVRIIDSRRANRSTSISGVTLTAPATGVSDHGMLLGLTDVEDHPGYLLVDGSRPLAGNLAVGSGVTVDGVDISAHAADPAAHHAPVSAGTLIGLSGQQVSLANGSAQYQVPMTGATPFAPVWTGLSSLMGDGVQFIGGKVAVLRHTDSGLAFGLTGGLTLGTPLSVSVASTNNVSGLQHGHAVISSSDPGANPAILATDASGYLTLVRLTLSDRLRANLIDTASGNMTVQPAADLILSPGSNLVKLAASKSFQSDGYASQATGMRITAAGEADFRYLFVDEMHAKSFIADLEQALAGGQIISKSVAVLATDFVTPAHGSAETMRVRDLPSAPNMAVFQSGDFVGLRQFIRSGGSLTINWCWGVVTNYADQADGTQTWTFTRSTTGGGAYGTIAADAIIIDFGTTGNGFYEVNAIDGAYGANSPYWRIATWATHPATQTVRVQGGNLRGLFGVANEFGLYAGDGTGTNNSFLRMSNSTAVLQNIPIDLYDSGARYVSFTATNGVQIVPGTTTTGDGYLKNNRAVTWHTALPGTAANYVGGIGAAVDPTRIYLGLGARSPDITRDAQVDLTVVRDGGTSAVVFMESLGGSSVSKIALSATRIYLHGALYADNGITGTPTDKPIWHAGNDGGGSGLDADLLDGNQASAFALLTGASFTGSISTTGVLSVGTNPAQSGYVRLPNNQFIAARNAANTADISLIGTDASNRIIFGGGIYLGNQSITGVYAISQYTSSNWTLDNAGNATFAGRILAATVGYDWSELTPQNNWANFGSPNATLGVKRFGTHVSVKGVVKAGAAIASNTAVNSQLASEYRPTAGRSFACVASIGGTEVVRRCYVDSSGYIRPQGAFSTNDWITLEFSYYTGG